MEIASQETALVRQAIEADASQIYRLLKGARFRHRHADWRLPADWLGSSGFVVAEGDQGVPWSRLRGCLLAVADPPPASWVRMAALEDFHEAGRILRAMLDAVFPQLLAAGAEELAWLGVERWPDGYLPELGFRKVNWITTYVKQDLESITVTDPVIKTRPATLPDMSELARIEKAAFEPLWRHSAQGLAVAFKEALTFDVAMVNGAIAGFQYSVEGYRDDSAHLVRITVDPEFQGRGVGSALLAHLLRGYWRRGIRNASLNTQSDNLASHALYEKFGFRRMGDLIPVWALALQK